MDMMTVLTQSKVPSIYSTNVTNHMEGNEPTARANTNNQPREMDKSAFEPIRFLLYMKSQEESRGIVMYVSGPEACRKCGEEHLSVIEFYQHYN